MKAKLQYCSITLLPHGTKQSSPSFLKSYLLGRDTSLILDLMINSLSSKPILYLGLWFVCLNFFVLYNRLSRKFHCMVVLTSFLFFFHFILPAIDLDLSYFLISLSHFCSDVHKFVQWLICYETQPSCCMKSSKLT